MRGLAGKATALLLASAVAHGQENPRAAVGQCYSACYERSHASGMLLVRKLERLNDFNVSDLAPGDHRALDWIVAEVHAFCAIGVQNVLDMDACNAGCADMQASGPVSSLAKSRFQRAFRLERDALRQIGLWNRNYTDAPTGDDLVAACNEAFDLEDPEEPRKGRPPCRAGQGGSRPDRRYRN